ncbi:hypothetical protein PPL_00458 [Heterostelium album PN500]|uniref:Uncharacterized protein n=1 Tax=Heterostelium pallidum (strain ATCC 26659 / Pp 5 / PN500) TaxID=670386 RepID=D3AWI4_HETP5|nr:hypothetical protein PPL_00458 [Heterostelium album PN500]EFA86657.1 hypothetical protein PPL_00458 [Heterostelium album PN500]|eukprot:XP_020438762.1 hypothetical protein PPL_00458 [Heterostelium album PN500]
MLFTRPTAIPNHIIYLSPIVLGSGLEGNPKCQREKCTIGLQECIYPSSMCISEDKQEPRCYELPDLYGDCSLTKQCKNNFFCNDGICERHDYSELCRTSDDCSSKLSCEASCANVHYPSCEIDIQCRFDEYCGPNERCTPIVKDGDSCNTTSSCHRYSKCVNETCTPAMRMSKGDSCTSTLDCDISEGLVCFNNTCTNDIDNIKCIRANPNCPHLSICSPVNPLFENGTKTMNNSNSENPTHLYDGICITLIALTPSNKKVIESFVECVDRRRCPRISNIQPDSCQSQCGEDPFHDKIWYACKEFSSGVTSYQFISLKISFISLICDWILRILILRVF